MIQKTLIKKDLMRMMFLRTYELLKLDIILCIFHVLISFYIYQTKHSFPNKFKSLPSKFRKCFWLTLTLTFLFSEKKLEYNTVQLHVYKEEYIYIQKSIFDMKTNLNSNYECNKN